MDDTIITTLDNGIVETKKARQTGPFASISYTHHALETDGIELWVKGGCIQFIAHDIDSEEVILTEAKAAAIHDLMTLALTLINTPNIHTIKDRWDRYMVIMSECATCHHKLTPLTTAQRSENDAREWAEATYPGLAVVSVQRYPNG